MDGACRPVRRTGWLRSRGGRRHGPPGVLPTGRLCRSVGAGGPVGGRPTGRRPRSGTAPPGTRPVKVPAPTGFRRTSRSTGRAGPRAGGGDGGRGPVRHGHRTATACPWVARCLDLEPPPHRFGPTTHRSGPCQSGPDQRGASGSAGLVVVGVPTGSHRAGSGWRRRPVRGASAAEWRLRGGVRSGRVGHDDRRSGSGLRFSFSGDRRDAGRRPPPATAGGTGSPGGLVVGRLAIHGDGDIWIRS